MRLQFKRIDHMFSLEGKEMKLEIFGLGIIFYSPVFTKHIVEGTDYLTSCYQTAEQVQAHIQKGALVGFGTGSTGTYILKFHSGYPDEELIRKSAYKLRLGLYCSGGEVYFRDLYDLMDWTAECPSSQKIELDDGCYHVTLCSDRPQSGILGDHQVISVYLEKLPQFPRLSPHGIPTLCE